MLEIKGVSVAYNGIKALQDVDFHVAKGQIFTLIGPNGAGKSTMLNAISGIVKSSGTVCLEGKPISKLPAHLRAREGLIQVPEGRRIISPLTVAENLTLGIQASGARGNSARDLDQVLDLFPVLAQRRKQVAGSMSGGQQQMLAIGRALMGRPKVLLLDEPSLGLAPVIVREVFQALLRLNKEGLTVLLVEQNARLALETAHEGAVLEQGRIVHSGSARRLSEDPVIADHYFGRAEIGK